MRLLIELLLIAILVYCVMRVVTEWLADRKAEKKRKSLKGRVTDGYSDFGPI